MKTIICYVLIVTISAAKDGDVYVYNSRDYYSIHHVVKPKPWSVFTFGYHSGDMLSMQIHLKNLSPNLSADVNLTYPSGVTMDKKQLDIYKGEKYFEIHHLLKFSKIFVELELSTTAGFCIRQQIVEGTDVRRIDETNDTPYNDICLRDEPCVIEVDLLKYICGVVVPIPHTFEYHYLLPVTETYHIIYILNVKTTNNTVIIILSLSGVTFILLAGFAYWKRGWIKHSSQGTPILPTNQHHEPFYLNMLFRRECDQEIAEIEQHQYEEISPQVTEGT